MSLPLADDGGSAAIRAGPSSLAGLGLFAAAPGKPAPIEYRMNGAPISDEEEQLIWENKLPGHEYLMSVATVDDNGFRDETGRLRPKTDAAAYVGRTLQELVWDSSKREWKIVPPLNYVGLLDPCANPAAYANDALYQVLDGVTQIEEYSQRDAELNALVLVPALRRREAGAATNSADSGKEKGASQEIHADHQSFAEFEFYSMWLYPRRGWNWTISDNATANSDDARSKTEAGSVFGPELTVGYYWPLFKPQPDAYAQFCSVS